MPDKRLMVLEFPAGGIDRGTSFQRQPPYTTPYAVNVRPRATISQRARGGSRPMLVQHCPTTTVVNAILSSKTVLDGGEDHSAAVDSAGTVWAWGLNTFGQIGDGTTDMRLAPVEVDGMSGVVAIACGDNHTLAVKSDGTVWAWGLNGNGQLGDGTTTIRTSPVQVSGLTDIVAVSAGKISSMALKSDGTVWAWGNNTYNQLGDGTTTQRTTPVQVSTVTGVVSIAFGTSHGMAVKSDGTVWGWGLNSNGQLGDGTTTQRSTPVQATGVTNGMFVAAGAAHTLLLKSDSSLLAWGDNLYGQIGDGTTTDRHTAVSVSGVTTPTMVACGAYHSLAVDADGTSWAWGDNTYGQLGDGTTTQRDTPTQMSGVTSAGAIAGGLSHTLVASTLSDTGNVYGCGANTYGEVGDGTQIVRTTVVSSSSLDYVIHNTFFTDQNTQLGTSDYRHINMIAKANTAVTTGSASWESNWTAGYGSWVYNDAAYFVVSSSGYAYNRSFSGYAGYADHALPAGIYTGEPFTIKMPVYAGTNIEYPLCGRCAISYGLDSYVSWAAPTGKTFVYLVAYREGLNETDLSILAYKVEAGVESCIASQAYSGVVNDSTTQVDLSLYVDGSSVSFYYNDHLLGTTAVGVAFSGNQIAVQVKGENYLDWATWHSVIAVGNITVDYSEAEYSASITKSVYASGGLVYIEDQETGALSVATESWTGAGYFAVSPLHPIRAVEMFGKLYIADYSTPRASGSDGQLSGTPVTTFDSAAVSLVDDWDDIGDPADDTAIIPNSDFLVISGSGTTPTNDGVYLITTVAAGSLTVSPAAPGGAEGPGLSFKIIRSPKVLDLATGTLSVWRNTSPSTLGWVPAGNPLIARFGGRIYLAGEADAPHVWYASRMGVPLDYFYTTDAKSALAGTSTAEGVIADAITALCPINEDIMCMTTSDEVWSMQGNLANGGQIINLSYEVGCIGADAWATSPEGILLFLSRAGVYSVDPTSGAFQSYNARQFSQRTLPDDLKNVDCRAYYASMMYDPNDDGIHLYLTPRAGDVGTHWYFDWQNKGAYMVLVNADHQPCAIGLSRVGELLVGGLDGYLRKYDADAITDDGVAMVSGTFLGPFAIAGPGRTGCLDSIQAVMGEGSSDVTWAVVVGNTAEEAYQGDAFASGTFVAGPNYTEWPRAGGAAAYLLLASTGRWAMESLVLSIRDAGPLRLA